MWVSGPCVGLYITLCPGGSAFLTNLPPPHPLTPHPPARPLTGKERAMPCLERAPASFLPPSPPPPRAWFAPLTPSVYRTSPAFVSPHPWLN